MPWKSGTIMDSRLEFVRLVEQGDLSISEQCRRFGISRETGHLYLRRYRESGVEGLKNHSSRPRTSPRRSEPEQGKRRVFGVF
jgi:transposase